MSRLEEVTLKSKRKIARSMLFSQCDADLLSLAEAYPDKERDTWDAQAAEAKALMEDSNASTPLITAALKPGETAQEYAAIILANKEAWSNYAGGIILKRRTYESRIDSSDLNSIEEIILELGGKA